MKANRLAAAQILCACAVGFGLSLPFIAVGGTVRSAYGLVQSAKNLDLVTGPVRLMLSLTVVSAPMMIGAMLLCVGLGWNRMLSALATFIAFLGIGSGIASLLVSSSTQLGPMFTVSGGAILLVTTVAVLVHQKRLRKQLQ